MKYFSIATLFTLSATLIGCGGGSKSGTPEQNPTTTSTVTELLITTRTADGTDGNTFERGEQLFLDATLLRTTTTMQGGAVTGTTSTAVSGVIVEFETEAGGFSPANGAAETDANGVATVALTATAPTGAYLVNAQTITGSVQTSANVTILAPPFPSIEVAIDPNNRLLSGQAVTVMARATRATSNGDQPIVDLPVTFATDGGAFNPTTPVARTNDQGIATVTFNPSFVAGIYGMTATADVGGDDVLGTLSYTIELPEITFDQPIASPALIDARGQSEISFAVTTSNGVMDTPVEIRLTSDCVQEDIASLPESVRTLNGLALATYSAQTCTGFDTIVAQPFINDVPLTQPRNVTIEINPPAVTQLFFLETTSEQVSIASLDNPLLPAVTDVSFQVLDDFENPVPNQDVRFSLVNTFDPDIALEPNETVTDENGIATVRVLPGLLPGSPRVRAEIPGSSLFAVATPTVITTGIPDQDSVSMSASTLNIEGWNFDGKETTITLRLADHYNNPVADGTPVLIRTEGGAVVGSCLTENGACSVLLISQNPRPSNGRLTVLAHTIGDESYVDLNGNGFYDDGEPFTDLPEPWLDLDEDGQRDSNEPIIDTNQNGQYNDTNTRYDGILCLSNCGSMLSTDIREDAVIVFGTSSANIALPTAITIDQVNTRRIQIEITDLNGNFMPAGTTVDITTTNGELAEPTEFTIRDTNSPGPFVITANIVGDGEPDSGTLTVTVTTPMDVTTIATMTVNDTINCGFSPQPPECDEEG